MKQKTFINDSWRLFQINGPAYVLLVIWILIIAIRDIRHVISFVIISIFSLCWLFFLFYSIWTGRLSKIIVYPNRIKWNKHFKSCIINIDDIRIEEVIPVRHHQWCLLVMDVNGNSFYMGLANSRHMAKLIDILQPSILTDVVKEEKYKCDDWRFNSAI